LTDVFFSTGARLVDTYAAEKYAVVMSTHLKNYDAACLEAGRKQIFNVYAFIFDILRIAAAKNFTKKANTCFHIHSLRRQKHQVITVLRSPHVNKKSREQFFRQRYTRSITTTVFLRPQKCGLFCGAVQEMQINFTKHRLSMLVVQFRSGEAFKYRPYS
jgi:5-methylcytosine-specific restriction endonuclease McrA